MFLTFDHVTKFYGPVIGVNNVSCRIGPGITGLFGANGAGKSTLMKLASGQLRPSQGDVRIGDHHAWSTAAKRHFGYVPDLNSFYEEMTCRDFVYVHGPPVRTVAGRRPGTHGRSDRRGGHVRSRRPPAGRLQPRHAAAHQAGPGADQRSADAACWTSRSAASIPADAARFRDCCSRKARKGKTILISSHILVETETLTDSVLIIARGRIVASGTLTEIRAPAGRSAADGRDRLAAGAAIGRASGGRARGARHRVAQRQPGDSDAQSGTVLHAHRTT